MGEGTGDQKMVQAYIGGKQLPYSESAMWAHRPEGAKSTNGGGPGRGAGMAQIHFWRGRHMGPETFIPGRSVGGAGGLLVRS